MPPKHPLYLQTVEGETGYIPASHASDHEDGGDDALALGSIAGTLIDAQVIASNVTQHQAVLAIATTQLTGDMPDARIVVGNVTQHQASLAIAWGQLTSVPTTVAGYGITDVYTEAEVDAGFSAIGHGHAASAITAGTFGTGSFEFPGELTLGSNMIIEGFTVNFGSTTSGGQRTLRLRSYTDNAIIYLESGYDTGAEQSEIIFSHGATPYFQIGKDASHQFRLYDHSLSGNALALTYGGGLLLSPAGDIVMDPGGGDVTVSQSGGVASFTVTSVVNNAYIYIKGGTDGGVEQAGIFYSSQSGTQHWRTFSHTDLSFNLYDDVNNRYFITCHLGAGIDITPTGDVTIEPSGGEIYLEPANQLFIGGNDSRPVVIDPGSGSIWTTASAGGWAMSWGVRDIAHTGLVGGYGFYGSADVIAYYWIGPTYNDESVRIYDPGSAVSGAVTVYIGQADDYFADLRLMGGDTGTTSGGRMLIYTAQDHDTNVDYYKMQAVSDDFIFYQGTTEKLRWDRGDAEWQFTGKIVIDDFEGCAAAMVDSMRWSSYHAVPQTEGATWARGGSGLTVNDTSTSPYFFLPLNIPTGVQINTLRVRGKRTNAGDTLRVFLRRVSSTGVEGTIATQTWTDTTGSFRDQETASLTEDVDGTYTYYALIQLGNSSATYDAALMYIELDCSTT